MPRADFYLIPEMTIESQWCYACRLLEKTFEQRKRAYVHLADLNAAHQFDQLLWTFHDIGFVPHHLAGEPIDQPTIIQVGHTNPPQESFEILFNLSETIPPFVDEFERVIEIIPNDASQQTKGRIRYQQYKKDHRDIKTHDLREAIQEK